MSIHQEREEEFFQICQDATQKPDVGSAGVYFSLGAGSPCGGGGMLWFDTRGGLLDLAQHLPYMNLGKDPTLNGRAWNKIEKIVDKIVAGEITLKDAIPLMDKALEPVDVGLTWWGYLSNLCEDGDEYARNLRSEFWELNPTLEELDDEDYEYEEKYDPIPDELIFRFADWISELGS